MSAEDRTPIACTLSGGDYRDRLAWIARLNRDGLRSQRRDALVLELRYAADVRDRVRELVSKEQTCCAFLTFDIVETGEDVRLTITAPERARAIADSLFEPFVQPEPASHS